jgi:hypothetical protein
VITSPGLHVYDSKGTLARKPENELDPCLLVKPKEDNMKKHLALTVLIGFACFAILTSLSSQTADAESGYEPIVDAFFTKLHEGKPEEAVTKFLRQNRGSTDKDDKRENLATQFADVVKTLGTYHGHELLAEKIVAGHIAQVTYLGLYERQPIMLRFQLYKPKDAWRGQSFRFDATFIDELFTLTDLETILKGQ